MNGALIRISDSVRKRRYSSRGGRRSRVDLRLFRYELLKHRRPLCLASTLLCAGREPSRCLASFWRPLGAYDIFYRLCATQEIDISVTFGATAPQLLRAPPISSGGNRSGKFGPLLLAKQMALLPYEIAPGPIYLPKQLPGRDLLRKASSTQVELRKQGISIALC